jgi:hypothetical protein
MGHPHYTPIELTRKLVKLLPFWEDCSVWEPHVGGGAFAQALFELEFVRLFLSDIDPNAPALSSDMFKDYKRAVHDALRKNPWSHYPDKDGIDFAWSIGNPPFDGFEKHIDSALRQSHNVAFLLRLAAMESKGRVEMWKMWPLRKVWVLAERPSFSGFGGGKTDSCAYGFFWFDRSYEDEPTIVPGWSWK